MNSILKAISTLPYGLSIWKLADGRFQISVKTSADSFSVHTGALEDTLAEALRSAPPPIPAPVEDDWSDLI